MFALNLGTLSSDAHLATGDPAVCEECGAYFNSFSKLNTPSSSSSSSSSSSPSSSAPPPSDEAGYLWVCEFCSHHNYVFIDDEEKPTDPTMDYILEAPPVHAVSDGSRNVVFVIDTSGLFRPLRFRIQSPTLFLPL